MKRALAIAGDYFLNALISAGIGALMSVAFAFIQGESAIPLPDAEGFALIGLACGVSSKAIIEGAFALFGTRRILAYLLNALVIAAVIWFLVGLVFNGFGPLESWKILLIFAIPEGASVFLVRAGIREALKLERAFDTRRDMLDSEDRSD